MPRLLFPLKIIIMDLLVIIIIIISSNKNVAKPLERLAFKSKSCSQKITSHNQGRPFLTVKSQNTKSSRPGLVSFVLAIGNESSGTSRVSSSKEFLFERIPLCQSTSKRRRVRPLQSSTQGRTSAANGRLVPEAAQKLALFSHAHARL